MDCLSYKNGVNANKLKIITCSCFRKEHFEIAYDTLKREDSDGGEAYIPVDSLRKLLTSLGEIMTDEEVEELITDMDNDNDGKIGHEEFIEVLTKK